MSTPLDFARADVGLHSVGGRFKGPPFEKYGTEGEIPLAWCARACRYWFKQAGLDLPGAPAPGKFDMRGSVGFLHEALDAAGWLLSPRVEPKPNDLILLIGTAGNKDGMVIGGHHIGLVETVTATTVQSIDGDWGTPDRVQRVTRQRSADDIWGYGRVPGASGGGSLLMKGLLAFGVFKGGQYAYRAWKRRKGAM